VPILLAAVAAAAVAAILASAGVPFRSSPESAPAVETARSPAPAAGRPTIDVLARFGTDDRSIRAAVDAAHRSGADLHFAAGTYVYEGTLVLDGVRAFGDGETSVLQASRPEASALVLRGRGVSLRNLTVSSPAAARRINAYSGAGIFVDRARRFTIAGVRVAKAENVGIVVVGGAGGRISGNVVTGTYADGIHLTRGTRDVLVSRNRVERAGDDLIAVVSYLADGALCSGITITGNAVRGQSWGRGITVVGGRDVTVARNEIADTSGAGVLVNSDGSFGTYGTANVRVLGNAIARTARDVHHGAVHLEGWPGHSVKRTVVRGNTISAAAQGGIVVGQYTSATVAEGNRISESAGYGVLVRGGAGTSIVRNRIERTELGGISVAAAARGALRIVGNTVRDANTSRSAGVDVIHVAAAALSSGEIRDNTYWDTAGYPYDELVDSAAPRLAVSGNRRR
jgi:hypothetical protein